MQINLGDIPCIEIGVGGSRVAGAGATVEAVGKQLDLGKLGDGGADAGGCSWCC